MAFQFYNVAKDELRDWDSGTYLWLLMKSGSFDATDAFVSDLTPGTNECTVPAYLRVAPDTPARSIGASGPEYSVASDPDFGDLTTSPESVIAVVLIKVVTNDSDSIPVCWGSFTDPISTSDLNPFIPTITDLLVGAVS